MRTLRTTFLISVLFAGSLAAKTFDLVVYGGTAGGVITAVSGARQGLSVVLLEPGKHLGGMLTGGLSYTDFGRKEVIGGYALEFYLRTGNYYETIRYGQPLSWYYEPHVGEQILNDMLREAGVTVLYNRRLLERDGVRKEGTRVVAVSTEDGETYEGRIFADCTYEGDLMAQAGVSYTWGREGMAEYGESLAGVREHTPFHQFLVKVQARDAQGKLLPEISEGPKGKTGAPDKKVQTYNYRLCLTDDPANQVPFTEPAGYDPKRYELLARLIEARTKAEGKVPPLGTFLSIDSIPRRKTDINNNGAFSTDYIGKSWDYPDATYRRRAEIWKEHEDYTRGLLWFFAQDPRVPEPLRKEMNSWGFAKDEFTDNNNWPHQLYVREARRMIGERVVIQKDLQTDLTKPDPIGMGSYNSDSHNVQRVEAADGTVENEGDVQVSVKPYQIPYSVMLPKRAQATNLLVPVCMSASHVAYSSLRMEPQYMIIGQAAGVAAKMAIAASKPVQDIDRAALTKTLRSQGAVLEHVASVEERILPLVEQHAAARPGRL